MPALLAEIYVSLVFFVWFVYGWVVLKWVVVVSRVFVDLVCFVF